jgi:hypothetical protein
MILYLLGAIVIFMLVLMSFMYRTSESNLLKGFWKADAEFCERAELEMFVVYLGDNTGYITDYRYGYLLAANKQGIILNNPINLCLSRCTNIMPGLATCKKYNASIDWLDNPPEDPDTFPTEFNVEYYPRHGKLVFYQDDVVIASLWKDCQMSALESDDSLIPDCISCADDDDDLLY